MTYAQLAGDAAAVTGVLQGAGVGAGALVGLVGDAGAGVVAGLLGIVGAGAGYVPVDVDAPVERGRFIVGDAHLDVVVVSGERARAAVDAWDTGVRVIEVGAAVAAGVLADGPVLVAGSAPAYVIYTSGTTGVPKGVLVPQRAVLRLVRGNTALPVSAADTLVQTGSLAFDASTFEIWGVLANGGTLVTASKDDVLTLDRFAGLIRENTVSVLWLTVSLFNQIIATDPTVLAGVSRVIIGGEQVSGDHVRRLHDVNPDITVINGYGPTENTTFTTTHVIPRGFSTVPIGRPISNTRVHILAGDRVCGIGETGQLHAAGDGLATGYLDRAELTAHAFTQRHGERLYRTGDLARWRADGTIDYLGRIDD
ncbi:AMP-binding protein, partial [Cryobacterium sp. 1639]|uniref:AMP-binding protein n=1 Tax=Cryobacterium inferilacus TaxID=2866629 RepID=UPI0027E2C407